MEGISNQQGALRIKPATTTSVPDLPTNCNSDFAEDCDLPGRCTRHRTDTADLRINLLIDTLRPINIATSTDQPRAPIRRTLIEQMSKAVGEPNSSLIEHWANTQESAQHARDALIADLEHALRAAEDADREAYQNFRTILTLYDNAAKLQGVLLPTYEPPSGWGPDGSPPQTPSSWDNIPNTGLWADDTVTYEWGWGAPPCTIPTPPSSSGSPITFATILQASTTSVSYSDYDYGLEEVN